MILVYCFAVLGVLALCALAYYWFVPDQSEVAPDRVSSGPQLDDEESARALAANLNAPLLEGSAIDLLLNGDQIFPAMLEAIDRAGESINLLTYIYWQGPIAERFADALVKAARRGVYVRLLVDAIGGEKLSGEMIDRLRRAGCHFAWFRPLHWYNLGRYNNRTHRKVMVVDGTLGFTGGVGIAQMWTGHAQDADHWRDNHYRVRGPAVRYLQGSFAVNWRQATGEVLAGRGLFPDLEPAGSVRTVAIDAAPSTRISVIGFTYWLLFRGARESITITTPYYVPDPRLELGLGAAVERGVRVTLLVPGRHTDSVLAFNAGRSYYLRLLQRGVRIYEFQPTMIHTKAVIVDGRWAILGSPNFDNRSFSLNYEEAMVAYDRPLATRLLDVFENDRERAREITLDAVHGWSLKERCKQRLARLVRAQI